MIHFYNTNDLFLWGYKMKKLLPILIIAILVISGFGTTATNLDEKNRGLFNFVNKAVEINFSKPTFTQDKNDQYLRITLKKEESYLFNPGQPMIPQVLKSFELPMGVKNIKIKAMPHDIQEISISKQILPAPVPVSDSSIDDFSLPPKKDSKIYNSKGLFPNNWFSYRIGCGLNKQGDHVTHLVINVFPIRYSPSNNIIYFVTQIDIEVTYDEPQFPISFPEVYDLVIIAPQKFQDDLQPLIDHKNCQGINTTFKSTNDIYIEYSGSDKPEQIKYFIKEALEKWGIQYVLLVGGLKSIIIAKPRDHKNYGSRDWYLPVRYSNLIFDEPGYLCDLYYADIYKFNNDTQQWEFDDWDSNNNGIFAEWNDETKDILDLYPDVSLGRLACRNNREVKDVVEKIINYETTADPSWFNKMIVISGDGFLDQEDWNIKWDTNGFPDGNYTIYAQSSNLDEEFGPVDEIPITLNKTTETNIAFNHDDHLKEELQEGYPAPPIAEIVSISPGNILGNTDYTYTPDGGEAYCNDLYWWANISYVGGVLTIRGKSYDPKPYGNATNIKIWIINEDDEIVFTDFRNETLTYYEGEWVTGEKLVHNRGGALYYMPEGFEKEIVWTSNGKFASQANVIKAFSKGYGFAFFSGHGSPGWWGDHFPGIPGNRVNGQVAGLVVTQVSSRFPFLNYPVFPMKKLTNKNQLPVVVVGGCHNNMFSVSFIPTMLDLILLYYFNINIYMHTYGRPIPECWGWYMVKLPKTGAIATMGNTGYGWGSEGEWCTIGVGDGWITSEFFRQYGENNLTILGDVYSQSLNGYISHHHSFTLPEWGDYGWDYIDEKTVQQFVLLGDPSLKMGGYN